VRVGAEKTSPPLSLVVCLMKIGIIADIHGNIPALNAVLSQMPEVEMILLAGDLAGKASSLARVFRIIDEYNMIYIRGNHEEVAEDYFRRFGGDEETEKAIRRIGAVPASREVDAGGLHMLMVHGSPWNETSEYIYPEYEAFGRFDDLGYDCVILGHTHIPMVIDTGKTLIINPGSVGEPMVQDPRPSYAVLDTDERRAEIHRVPDFVETRRVRSVTPFRWGRSIPEETARAWGIEIKK